MGDAARAGVDLVQLRERDLPARALLDVARRARAAVAGTTTRLLVNDRLDVALAAGLDGVHLTTRSLSPAVVRACAPAGLLVGVSTHSAGEVRAAEAGGADLAVCGPAYDTPSKRGLGEPLGPERVGRIARAARIPVLALGGITPDNAREALAAGATGVAAIRLFQEAWLAGRLAATVADLRRSI